MTKFKSAMTAMFLAAMALTGCVGGDGELITEAAAGAAAPTIKCKVPNSTGGTTTYDWTEAQCKKILDKLCTNGAGAATTDAAGTTSMGCKTQ